MKRSPLKRRPMKRRGQIPTDVRQAAYRRSRWLCIAGCGRTATHLHHVMPVRLFPALWDHPDNLVAVCHECHEYHERAVRRIRWNQLPECAITLAHTTSGAAAVFLEKTYPR